MNDIVDRYGDAIKAQVQKSSGHPEAAIIDVAARRAEGTVIKGQTDCIRFDAETDKVHFNAAQLESMPDVPDSLVSKGVGRKPTRLCTLVDVRDVDDAELPQKELNAYASALWIGQPAEMSNKQLRATIKEQVSSQNTLRS